LRLLAAGLVIFVLTAACARTATTSTSTRPLDLYAAEPTQADVKAMLGDDNWWPGPPSFGVRPLDSASMPRSQRFRVTQRFAHIGTSETFDIAFTQWSSTSTATTQMTDIKTALGQSANGAKVGDDVLYYGLQGIAAAPYETATFVRVGSVVTVISWSRKDGYPKIDQLSKIASNVVARLKNVLSGKVRATPLSTTDAAKLPPKGPDITLLGAAMVPVESVVVMLNFAAPELLSRLLRNAGAESVVFGDYVLDNDTHMEVRAGLLDFVTSTVANEWIDALRGSSVPDANGIATFYDHSTGQYFSLFTVGTKGAMLVCRSTNDGESASRSCETPLARVAPAWQLSLQG
jgi:hypothetical protein